MSDFAALAADIDAIGDVPLPRWRRSLVGHDVAQRSFAAAWRSGRLHHAWLITGPEGIGKATLAFRIARFLLANPSPNGSEGDLGGSDFPMEHPVFRQVAGLSHPDLVVLRRSIADGGTRVRGEIVVDDARALMSLFTNTSAGLGWRVAIVDAADDLNRNAANALLKMLEEPPPRAVFLLVSHAPARLLPTIRSRCRRLDLAALSDQDTTSIVASLRPDLAADRIARAVARARGRPRLALSLLEGDGLATVEAVEAILAKLPNVEAKAAHAFAERLARRDGEGSFALFVETLEAWLSQAVRAGVADGQPVAALAEAHARIVDALRATDIYNLDRKQFVLDTVQLIAEAITRRRAA